MGSPNIFELKSIGHDLIAGMIQTMSKSPTNSTTTPQCVIVLKELPADVLTNTQDTQKVLLSSDVDRRMNVFRISSEKARTQIEIDLGGAILMAAGEIKDLVDSRLLKVTDVDESFWGIFIPADSSQQNTFRMLPQKVTKEVDGNLRFNDIEESDLLYRYDSSINTMTIKREHVVEQNAIPKDISGKRIWEQMKTALNESTNDSVIGEYLDGLLRSTRKFIRTEKDSDVFFNDLNHMKFKTVERRVQQVLWDKTIEEKYILVAILDRYMLEFQTLEVGVERDAITLTLKVLTEFIKQLQK